MRNFCGVPNASVNHQPLMSTLDKVGLNNSMASVPRGTEVLRASEMRMGAMEGGAVSFAPGEPKSAPLARQLEARPQVSHDARSLRMTSEKPWPSVIGCQ